VLGGVRDLRSGFGQKWSKVTFWVKWSKSRLLASRFWRSCEGSRGLMLYSGNISYVLVVLEVLRMERG